MTKVVLYGTAGKAMQQQQVDGRKVTPFLAEALDAHERGEFGVTSRAAAATAPAEYRSFSVTYEVEDAAAARLEASYPSTPEGREEPDASDFVVAAVEGLEHGFWKLAD